jgi:LCP family protein required for cell wall assembly
MELALDLGSAAGAGESGPKLGLAGLAPGWVGTGEWGRRAVTRPRSTVALHEPAPPRPPQWTISLAAFLFGLWVGGGLLSGWLFLRTIDALLRGIPPPPPPVILIREVAVTVASPGAARPAQPSPTAASLAAPPAPTQTATPEPEEPLPTWDGTDRVTVLLLGIDQRPEEKAARTPARSDTMILVTLDPLNLTGGMLSLPRDLLVPIRGHGEDKLNTAHFWGDYDHYGGGLDLARRTVQYNFGVPVHFVARVDFDGFVKLIDAVGGITVDVDRAILDDQYPDEEYGLTRLYVPVGPQRLSGRVALKYARTRHADSDFGRIQRQRKVLQAAREEALAIGIVPKLPSMLGIVRDAVATDIPITTLLALANLARQVPSGAIASRQIDASEVLDPNQDGSVIVPNREKIRPIVQELFYDPVVKKEAARVEVLNGTRRDGLATAARAALQTQGFVVTRADSADSDDYSTTAIVDRSGKSGTVERLAAALGVAPSGVRKESGGGGADVTVVLGTDFRGVR